MLRHLRIAKQKLAEFSRRRPVSDFKAFLGQGQQWDAEIAAVLAEVVATRARMPQRLERTGVPVLDPWEPQSP